MRGDGVGNGVVTTQIAGEAGERPGRDLDTQIRCPRWNTCAVGDSATVTLVIPSGRTLTRSSQMLIDRPSLSTSHTRTNRSHAF